MTSSLTDNGSRATVASLRCRLAPPMLTGGLLLPCHDVYICSEGGFQSKKSPKCQQTGRKRQGNGSKRQLLQIERVTGVFKIPVLSSRRRSQTRRLPASERKARPGPPPQAPVCKHSSKFKSKEKPEFPTGCPGEPTADGGGPEQIGPLSRNLQRRQRRLQPGCL